MNNKKKKYRPNVAAVVLSSKYPRECEILIANRSDIKEEIWQFPQGGINEKEDPKEALFRELKEEIGTASIEIITEYPKWIAYDFANKSAKKLYPYDGQIQKYFLVKLKPSAKIDINTQNPEFCEFMFVKYNNIFDYVSYIKKPIYKQVLAYFKKMGYL